MNTTQFVWFLLIGVLFAGYFFLDGFDLGVGMCMRGFARNTEERNVLIRSIGPLWDGNEVWLVTAGGAMFAAFPFWYATLFSGYYLVFLFILVALIMRGISFEFRARVSDKYKYLWDYMLVISSFFIPFLFGMVFTSMIQGMPIDAEGNIVNAHFTDYFNWLSVVGGIALTLLCYLHGLNYISLKSEKEIRLRAKHYAEFFYWVLYVGLIVFVILLAIFTDFFKVHPIGTSVMIGIIVLLTLIAQISVFKRKEMMAFMASGLTNVALVTLIFVGLFPRVMPSTLGHDLMIAQASSNPYTLHVMLIVACSILPFVIAYTIWTYYVFRKRISTKEVKNGGY